MLDALIVVLTLAAKAPEMAQTIEEAKPLVVTAEELEAHKKFTAHDAAASTAAQIAAHEAWHAEQEAAAEAARKAAAVRSVPSGSVWDRLAQCESGGRWDLNVGTYDGGLQFHPNTWIAAGGRKYAEYAWQATREQQIAIAESWLAKTSWSQWPACSKKLGLR